MVDIYLQLIEAQKRLEILEGQLRDDEDALSVTLHRFQQGLSPQIEVLQQTQQRDRTSSQLPPAQAVISILKRRIAALRGEARLDELTLPQALPLLPELPKLGIPATVLEARPDIQAMLARVSAADARVSAAFSARLPGLRIGASGGYQSFELKELFDDFIWSLTGSLITPLFQGGRLRAEQSRAEAQLRERILALKERSLLAYHEIEDALINERSAVDQLSRVRAQRASAQSLFESAERRYLQGVGDFLTMLAARQGLYASQLAVLSAERGVLTL
jgi:outer membrane protein TolC